MTKQAKKEPPRKGQKEKQVIVRQGGSVTVDTPTAKVKDKEKDDGKAGAA